MVADQSQAGDTRLVVALQKPSDLFAGASNTDLLSVVSTTSNSAVLGLYTCGGTCGTGTVVWTLDTAPASDPYLNVVAGAAFKGSNGDNLAFAGLDTSNDGGKWVSVYKGTAGGQNQYAVVSLTQ